ncbi:MAG: UDP-N-acetylmuramoyl-L-alanyl-D-glutamate--2,6-diaminopimelate ligase [Actinobacteria bacterium]|nr:UDP-N-acetylmuramoyl-L-alanyl-D-glutamate--2,6-diaminopimelate ligase [Actinomycetota bacterium]
MRSNLLLEYSLSLSEIANLIGSSEVFSVNKDLMIQGLTLDSNDVIAGDLFVALPGLKVHGAKFVESAVANGAVAVLTDSSVEINTQVPVIRVEDPRYWLGIIADKFYRNPSSAINVIGITGTNGKTTTSYLLQQIWEFNNRTSGLIGTIETRISDEVFPTIRTTPEAPELQSTFAIMRERHNLNVVIEVSSHALALNRVEGTKFSVVAFTNLSQDHLDFHKNMEDYYQAKSRLFKFGFAEKAIINIDDPWGKRLFDETEIEKISVSTHNDQANWKIIETSSNNSKVQLTITGPGGILLSIESPLIGDYNGANLLMALALAVESGIDPLAAADALNSAKGAPGRMESIDLGQSFSAIVDYAHTPDAVSAALKAVRGATKGKIIAVLGCGGDRDATKRSLMGNSLISGADIAIFTSDNPRSENPLSILTQMHQGIGLEANHFVIVDRREAIKLAVGNASQNDCVLILGKGHETGQEIMGKISPFDDRVELKNAIRSARSTK